MPGGRILLGVGGGIAAYKAAEVLRRLRERGLEVRSAMTVHAEAFLAPLTLEVLSEHPVYRQEYLTATGRGEESHIAVAAWADLLCIAPATANLLTRLALGLADDFLTTTALAFGGPVVVAPAMHPAMWRHPALRQHLATLEARGVRRIGPVEGPLASGEEGIGRMAEPEAIAAAVCRCLEAGPLAGRRVLVSAGPTHEAVDPVRFLGNRSSGKMGFAVAAEAAARGAETWLVAGPVALATPAGVERVDVRSAQEMKAALERRAAEADLIVMAAAVADFRPLSASGSKIRRQAGERHLELVSTPDILAGLAELAPDARRIGFAAETEPSAAEARRKLERKRVHFLVVNDVSRPDIGFESDDNEVIVYRSSGEPIRFAKRSKRELAAALLDLVVDATAATEL